MGWIGGWLGGFIWVVILSIIFLVQGQTTAGVLGLALSCVAVVVIMMCAPWKHPNTPYWKLMLPVYALFFGALAWAVWSYGGTEPLGLSLWSAFLLLLLLLPFATAGRRRWNDSVAQL